MTNAEVARVFEQVADLMEIRGDDSFRVNAYRKVARTVADLAEDINDLAARDELGDLPGVGKASRDKLLELLRTGRLTLYHELCQDVPETLLGLREIPSLGPKKIALLWRECGVTDLAGLKLAIDEGRLAGVRGFAEKSIALLRKGIEFRARSAGRHRLGVATAVAELMRRNVLLFDGVRRVEHAGSLRRGRETVGDLDLLCIADDGATVTRRLGELPGVQQVLGAGDTKGSVLFEYEPGRTIQVDLRVVPAESFGAAWQYFTGSKEHNVRLRELAVKRGWSLNEYGLTEGARVLAAHEEAEIYAALGLPWIPPELREDRDEFALRATPKLLELGDIRGDLHLHTLASDGVNTIEAMVLAARERGYEYVCITDHSQSSTIANGLKPDRLREHVAQIRRVAREVEGITVWAGAEVDILSGGKLDYPDKLLAELDWVVASVHVGMGSDAAANTARTLAAIHNPYVNVIAHPTGRLINRREAMPLDIAAIAQAAAATGTALEINASAYRLDLKDQHARLARDAGVWICIDTDAHSTDQFDEMQFGVLTARRAGLTKADVLNTQPIDKIAALVDAKRTRAAARPVKGRGRV